MPHDNRKDKAPTHNEHVEADLTDGRNEGRELASHEAREVSSSEEINQFLQLAKRNKPVTDAGRLIFSLDATMSRQPTWDMAMSLQAEMFDAVEDIAGLAVQLVFFRGLTECKSTKWATEPATLRDYMSRVTCRAGATKIGKVLKHAVRETKKQKVDAIVYIGDACEENPDLLAELAGTLKIYGVPLFIFQEGFDPIAQNVFRELAKLSGGAYHPFNANSARELAELLKSVAAYAASGKEGLKALAKSGNKSAPKLLAQLDGSD